MSISVELSNLGPLRAAQLNIADLTLLVGENNTGKTFFATVLHRVLDASPLWSRLWYDQRIGVPSEVEEWIVKLLEASGDDPSLSEMADMTPGRDTVDWATNLTTEILKDYGNNVRDAISYAFGAEAAFLRRRTRSRHAADCYLRISSSEPAWHLEVRFDSKEITVEPPDPELLLEQVLRPDEIRDFIRPITQLRRSQSTSIAEIFRTYPNPVHFIISAFLFTSWPRRAVHLPADRTGIMQSHNVLAGAAVRQSARAGIRPIQIETLPGTSADFLSLILEIPKYMASPRHNPSRYSKLANNFEKQLRAEITVDQRMDSLDAIMAVTPEGRFPMARVSSMLSELAPLLLILKSPGLNVDNLTIDEPEAHLHPAMQITVASLFARLINEGMRIVVTTHSDFFISQCNNMMRFHELQAKPGSIRSPGEPKLDRSRVRALHFLRNDKWCFAQDLIPDAIDGVDASTFTDVMGKQYNRAARFVNVLLEMDVDNSQ